jgi:hypothetical protein
MGRAVGDAQGYLYGYARISQGTVWLEAAGSSRWPSLLRQFNIAPASADNHEQRRRQGAGWWVDRKGRRKVTSKSKSKSKSRSKSKSKGKGNGERDYGLVLENQLEAGDGWSWGE